MFCSVLQCVPVLQDAEAPGRHAVDAPVRDAVLVADGHAEAAVVGAHHLGNKYFYDKQIFFAVIIFSSPP